MIIKYWSDFVCPFCYIAENRMKKALKELGMEDQTKIIFKAFELNPGARKIPKRTVVEGFARHYGMTPEQAAARVEGISAIGRADGLVFNYATAYNVNTFDALRLAKLAQSKSNDLGNIFVDRLYRAFFEENLILSDHEVLARLASEVGLPADEVADVLGSDRYADDVRSEESQAYSLGIHAVPFFVINDKYGIPGAVDIEDMRRVLVKAYNEEEAEAVSGMVCGPDGCRPAE